MHLFAHRLRFATRSCTSISRLQSLHTSAVSFSQRSASDSSLRRLAAANAPSLRSPWHRRDAVGRSLRSAPPRCTRAVRWRAFLAKKLAARRKQTQRKTRKSLCRICATPKQKKCALRTPFSAPLFWPLHQPFKQKQHKQCHSHFSPLLLLLIQLVSGSTHTLPVPRRAHCGPASALCRRCDPRTPPAASRVRPSCALPHPSLPTAPLCPSLPPSQP